MKNLVLMLVFLIVAIGANAQTKVSEVTPDDYLKKYTYEYVWGTTADTLTNADTLNFVYRVGNSVESPDINIKLYNDHVSGTAGGTLVAYSSIDGVNYAAIDTITVSSLSADAMDAEVISITDYMYPYLKLIYLQTGTAVTIPFAYVYAKFN